MKTDLVSYMVRSPYVAAPDMSPQAALEMMRELEFRHLPVVQDGKLVGIVSERDLREVLHLPQVRQLKLEDLMKTHVYTVQKDTSLKAVVTEMADRKLGSAIVLNPRREVVGIFTTTDALRILAEIMGDEEADEFLLKDDLYECWDLDAVSA